MVFMTIYVYYLNKLHDSFKKLYVDNLFNDYKVDWRTDNFKLV